MFYQNLSIKHYKIISSRNHKIKPKLITNKLKYRDSIE